MHRIFQEDPAFLDPAQRHGGRAAALIQACDNTVAAQRWQTLSAGQIKHVSTGLCLAAPASTVSTDLTLAACNSTVAGQCSSPRPRRRTSTTPWATACWSAPAPAQC
ncbi:ricin-type beta-trefoil lectin domain protein [Streptomyces sp. NPDC096132]|uniref:ricin-type beta-trefoil lectin domain protein n=1 Tax=Streptomyces sp. NPDC096132 TaxID=3366075 RepID=UPI0038247CB8